MVLFIPAIPGEVLVVLPLHAGMLAVFVATLIGLWRRTRWGFWLAWTQWGLFAIGGALACTLSLANPEERTFFGSRTGAITFAVTALFSAAPFLLLAKARRRYFAR
jgi:hypothetical protein